MERRFLKELKSFALSVLEGPSVLRVEEKRQGFLGAVVLSFQSSTWLATTIESLLGFSEDQDFIKSSTKTAGSWRRQHMDWVVGEGSF